MSDTTMEHQFKAPIEKLRASPTQPRTYFNQQKHLELVESVQAHGIIQPIVVRALPDSSLEIVLGERRVRAARELKLETVPAWLRVLSDTEVIEQQLIENLQRDDLNPIEEADSYKRMLNLPGLDGANGAKLHTIESIAKRIGRDRKVVYRSLLLCDLDDGTKSEVASGFLPPTTAGLIALIPDATNRAKAAEEILHPKTKTGPLSFRDADDHIEKYYTRDLRSAKFDQDDGVLVPPRFDDQNRRIAGGKCSDCPFKAANMSSVETPQRKNRCHNPSCFDEKENAEWARWQKAETDIEKNRRALSREESAEIFSGDFPDQPSGTSGLVSLDQFPASDELRADEEAPGTWRLMTGDVGLEIQVARDRKGNTHELVERKRAIEAARMNGHDVFKTNERGSGAAPKTRKSIGLVPPADLPEAQHEEWLNHKPGKDEESAQRKIHEKEKSERETLQKTAVLVCLEGLRKKAKMSTAFLRKLVLFIFSQHTSVNEDLCKRHKLPVTSDIARNIVKWGDADLIALAVDIVATDAGRNYELDDDDREWFRLFGIDHKAEEKRQTALLAKDKKADAKALEKVMKKK